MFEVDYFQLDSSAAVINKYVTLNGTPITPNNVALDTIGGTSQALGGDFTIIDSSKLSWSGLGLDGTNGLAVGDNIRVIYDRS